MNRQPLRGRLHPFIQGILVVFLGLTYTTSAGATQRHFDGPRNVIVGLDESTELTCQLSGGVVDDVVVWSQDNFILGTSHSHTDLDGYSEFEGHYPRYRAYANKRKGEYRLKILRVTEDDEGEFTCTAMSTSQNPHAVASEAARVTVLVPPTNIHLKGQLNAHDPAREFELRANKTYTFACQLGPSKPPAAVLWKVGETPLENGRSYVQVQNSFSETPDKKFNATSSVTFTAQRWMDERSISCAAGHQALKETLEDSRTLSVHYKPVVNITLTPSDAVRREFSSLHATCSIQSKPAYQKIRWFISGRLVPNATSETLAVDSLRRDMHNTAIQCQAENQMGNSTASAVLQINYGPRFLSRETSKVRWVNFGEQLTLSCNDVNSNPPASITWYKKSTTDYDDVAATAATDGSTGAGGGEEDQEVDYDVDVAGDKVIGQGLMVTLKPMEVQDFGTYSCVADVHGFKKITRKFYVGRRGKPRMHSQPEQVAFVGRKAEVRCIIRGSPLPDKISWLRNGEVLDFDKEIRYNLKERETNYGKVSSVEIFSTTEADFALFNCTASNMYGSEWQVIVLRKKEVVPFYCWIATAVIGGLLLTMVVTAVVCCKCWSRVPGSVACCQKKKKIPSSDGSAASTSQTSSDSMDMKRICNLPDISIPYSQTSDQWRPGKGYSPASYGKQSPVFDTLEKQKHLLLDKKLLHVGDSNGIGDSYKRFDSPHHHVYSYHPNRPPYHCDSPECHATLALRSGNGLENFGGGGGDSYGTGSSRACSDRQSEDRYRLDHERENFLGHHHNQPQNFKPYGSGCPVDDCYPAGPTAFKAYSKYAAGVHGYGGSVSSAPFQRCTDEDATREEEYADNIRKSQYNTAICIGQQPSPSRSFCGLQQQQQQQRPNPYNCLEDNNSSTYQARAHALKQQQQKQSPLPYDTPSPTDSKLSTNV